MLCNELNKKYLWLNGHREFQTGGICVRQSKAEQ